MTVRNRVYKIVLFVLILFIFFFGINYFSIHKIQFNGYYSNKIWGHKANSLDRIKKAEKNFIGLEIDLIYVKDHNIFDVRHPPDKSINLSLENCLAEIENNDMKLWLDIKNLNQNNSTAIFNRIDNLIKKYGFSKRNVLIESSNSKSLKKFTNADYSVSYYIPYLHTLSNEERKKSVAQIKNVLKLQNNIGISSTCLSYSILKEEFPEIKKNIWCLGNTRTLIKCFEIREMLEDTSVNIVLVTFK